MTRRLIAGLATVAIVATACSSGGDDTATTAPPTADTTASTPPTTDPPPSTPPPPQTTNPTGTTPPATAPPSTEAEEAVEAAALVVTPGTEQITVTGAEVGQTINAYATDGAVVATATADEFGAVIFRKLDGAATYTVGDDASQSEPVTALDRAVHPDPGFYAEQRLPDAGLGYITTRDGTTLSASVWLPGAADEGPYPTVVEYSGYSPSNPESAGFPDAFTALGYAYVGVNVRGTGCSGGSFRYFEYTQSLDGYDVIETVAAQPWVQDNRVGMVGVSYPGISQLFVAQTQPPSLAAITPLSVLADSAISTLYPGGILNTGFAVPWTEERINEAQPEGQAWSSDQIAAGDELCKANQSLRLQNPDLLAEITDNPFWTDEVAGEIAPRLFVDQIEVPTLLAGAWQDEQTGGHFPTMLDQFTGTDQLFVTVMNGLHTDSVSPAVFPRLVEFLDLYVAERTPSLGSARFIAPILAGQLFGTGDVALPPTDRFDGMTHAEALAVFESEPPIRVLFEHGAADGFEPLAPNPRFEAAFDAWPIPTAEATAWYLAADTRLAPEPEAASEPSSYLALPDAIPPTWYDGSSSAIWRTDVTYDWQQGGPGTFLAFATDELATDTAIVGSGSVDLYLQSNLGDTDIEVTISEIRPDGQELYIQSGWLRASHRTLDETASSELRPVHSHLEADAAPLPEGEFELVRVEIFPFAHVFRAGSRIRLTVDAPGGNRPVWEFQTIAGGEQVTIAHDAAFPSRIVLPVVPDIDAPAGYPACDSLRGQPCRPYDGN